MSKGKQGYERGAGPYSKVSDGVDKITQGDKGDLPAGKGSRQLDIDVLDRDARQNGSAKLPKKA